MAQDIVTLDQVKRRLRIYGSEEDDDLLNMIDEATSSVLDYVRQRVGDEDERAAWYATVDAWTEDDAPPQVRAAIIRMVGFLFGPRGDDVQAMAVLKTNGSLPNDVAMLVNRLRDVAIA